MFDYHLSRLVLRVPLEPVDHPRASHILWVGLRLLPGGNGWFGHVFGVLYCFAAPTALLGVRTFNLRLTTYDLLAEDQPSLSGRIFAHPPF